MRLPTAAGTPCQALARISLTPERCSVTRLLITTPEYRICTVCPAVSRVPASWGGQESQGIAQMALDAAVACVMCGGRWARPV